MKIPEVAFIKHCPNLAPERKVFLEEHLKERVSIKDIRWIEDYNHDHLFVQWLNAKLKLPYGPKLTSNFVKTIFMMKQMVDEKIESALHIDDDVVFYRDWDKILESIPDEVEHNGYINMGTSPFFNLQPKLRQVYQIPNNGGAEVIWVNLDFALSFLTNLNMEEAPDIAIHGLMMSMHKPILNIPIAHQTSNIERVSTVDHDTRKSSNWQAYVQNYKNLPKINFNKLLEEFKQFEEKKKRVEEKFYELYGKKVDIKNVKYILNEDQDHRVNILDFKLIEDKMNI
ncbi:hypothetical protein OtV6_042c [Ostreococcus tauri virus RT-2011]|nr:hypothetical protein OtV6_042c [Ostreococcus tauri virus RT-2011]